MPGSCSSMGWVPHAVLACMCRSHSLTCLAAMPAQYATPTRSGKQLSDGTMLHRSVWCTTTCKECKYTSVCSKQNSYVHYSQTQVYSQGCINYDASSIVCCTVSELCSFRGFEGSTPKSNDPKNMMTRKLALREQLAAAGEDG